MTALRLRDLLLFLNTQTKASFLGSAVDTFLERSEIDLDDLMPFTRFREDTYARNLIHRTDLYELFVLAWLPGQRAAVHDHAGQRCWMSVVSGELTIQDYSAWTPDAAAPHSTGKPKRYGAAQTIYIDDGMGMHSLANVGRAPALSMHLYAGPIARCRAWDEKRGKFKLVELESFPPPRGWEWNKELPLLLE